MNLSEQVYKKLLEVPEGSVTTYLELSKAVGLKNGQRVIGQIMKNNPFPAIVPCHRVVKSDGKIGGYAYGQNVKANMLKKEGIKIQNGKILDWNKTFYQF
ncbi:MAG TPA: MGMT family protein [Nitrosopumilaceae archaeon]|nr:MGMT family protein [Nitrosopumilaceae archaeon]